MGSWVPDPEGGGRMFIARDGVRKSKTFKLKGEATAWAAREEAKIIAHRGDSVPDMLFRELIEKYRDEYTITKRGQYTELARIGKLLGNSDRTRGKIEKPDPIAQINIRDLTSRHVSEWRDRRLKAGVQGSTVNREWSLLRAICSVAQYEWRWLRENPFAKEGGVKKPANPPHREEVFTDEDLAALQVMADRLTPVAPKAAQIMRVIRFEIETGMRGSETRFIGNFPEHVSIPRKVARLPANAVYSTKNGTSREVPLSSEAVRLWEEALAQGEKGNVWGFNSKASMETAWYRLREATAISTPAVKRLHLHDTRHTAATRWAKKLSLMELCRMFGWRDPKFAMVYYNESAESIAQRLG